MLLLWAEFPEFSTSHIAKLIITANGLFPKGIKEENKQILFCQLINPNKGIFTKFRLITCLDTIKQILFGGYKSLPFIYNSRRSVNQDTMAGARSWKVLQ
jgi:hypothetical protein